MLVAVWAAAFAVRPRQMKAFGEKAGFIVERGGFEDRFIFGGDEKSDDIRFVFEKTVWLLKDWFQKRDGITAGTDRAIEAYADRISAHPLQ